MSINLRLVIAIVLAATLPLLVGSVWSLYTLQQASSLATKQSEAALIEQGEVAISAQAVAVARQIELYLEMHPEIDLTDTVALESNAELAKISVQPVGKTGYTAVFDAGGITHFHVNPKNVGMDMSTLATTLPEFWAIFKASLDGSTSAGYYDWKDADGKIRSKYMYIVPVGNTRLRVAATTYIDEFYQPVVGLGSQLTNIQTTARIQIFLFLGFAMLLASGGAYVLGRRLSRPIQLIAEAADRAAAGDMRPIDLEERNDEIGVLARAYNKMMAQQRELIGSLEGRTHALTTSAEVSRRLSTILNRKELVTEVVNQVKNAFNYYHAQIYFYDEAKENLVMAGGTGEAGEMMLAQFHKIAKGRGLVGRAAETNTPVLVANVSQSIGWLPNPLLPETKSEAAIPISIGKQVLGVLDVQHNVIDGLKQEDVDSLQSIANQVAVALQNVQSTEIMTKRAMELQTVAAISTAAATISDLDKMLHSVVHLTQRQFSLYHCHVFIYNENTAAVEIAACSWKEGDPHEGTDDIAVIPIAQEQSLVARAFRTRQAVIVNDVHVEPGWLPNPLLPDTQSEMAVPLVIGDQVLGVLDVQSEHLHAFTEEDASIQTTLASQVAIAVNNARSFSQSQRQAERETSVNLISQKIQNATSVEAALQIAARELGRALGMKSTLVTLDPKALADEHKGN